MSNYKELKNIGVVYSSNYSRAMATFKYVATNNNVDINVVIDLVKEYMMLIKVIKNYQKIMAKEN